MSIISLVALFGISIGARAYDAQSITLPLVVCKSQESVIALINAEIDETDEYLSDLSREFSSSEECVMMPVSVPVNMDRSMMIFSRIDGEHMYGVLPITMIQSRANVFALVMGTLSTASNSEIEA